MADYTNEAQQRVLNMLRLLAGNEFTGLLPSEIAREISASPAIVTRDLFNLCKAGYAEQIPETGRWRLGPRLVQIAVAFGTHLDAQRKRVDEIAQRYTTRP